MLTDHLYGTYMPDVVTKKADDGMYEVRGIGVPDSIVGRGVDVQDAMGQFQIAFDEALMKGEFFPD